MADFLDVNVWVALSVLDHPLHGAAVEYWGRRAAANIIFCRTTAFGLIRVCSQANTLGGAPLSPREAWEVYKQWRDHPGVLVLSDSAGIDAHIDNWISEGVTMNKSWTDTYLAAFAAARSLRLVTFDKGFSRFTGLDMLLLAAA